MWCDFRVRCWFKCYEWFWRCITANTQLSAMRRDSGMPGRGCQKSKSSCDTPCFSVTHSRGASSHSCLVTAAVGKTTVRPALTKKRRRRENIKVQRGFKWILSCCGCVLPEKTRNWCLEWGRSRAVHVTTTSCWPRQATGSFYKEVRSWRAGHFTHQWQVLPG